MARKIRRDSQKDIKQYLKFMEEVNMSKYTVTTGVRKKPQKVVIYGPSGIGKTTLSAQAPDPVFIDTEDSTMQLNVSRYPKPANWEELLDMVMSVCETNYKTLIIDTADWAEHLCMTHVCKKMGKANIEDFGYGKGYQYLTDEFKKLLDACDVVINNGINVILVAHAMMRKFEQPDEMGAYDRWEMKTTKKTSPLIKEWADALLFCNYKTTVVDVNGTKKAQGGKRIILTEHNPCWDAKNRHGLKPELPMEYKEIDKLFFRSEGAAPVRPELKEKIVEAADDLGLPFNVFDTFPDDFTDVPEDLAHAIKAHGLTIRDVQYVVSQKGWADVKTHPKDYEPGLRQAIIANIDKIKVAASKK